MMKFSGLIVLLALILVPPHLADGRIPVSQPTTITQSGHYVVTRDIDVSGPDGIVIDATSVTLDLNGFSIRGSASTVSLVRATSKVADVEVTNGRLHGGQTSILSAATGGVTIESVSATGFTLRAIEIVGARRVVVGHNIVDGEGAYDTSQAIHVDAASGRIEDNTIRMVRGAIAASFQGSGIVSRNVISHASEFASGAQAVYASGIGVQITDNAIDSYKATGITVSSQGSTIARNTISGADGYCLSVGIGNYIHENTFFGCTNNGSVAVYLGSYNLFAHNNLFTGPNAATTLVSVSGSQNVLDSNTLANAIGPGGTTGVRFGSASSMNVFRDNVIRGSVLPVDDLGTGNVDGGGNNF